MSTRSSNTLSSIRSVMQYLLRRSNESIHRLAFRTGYKSEFFDHGRIEEMLTDASAITFLCYGNICRSPFAEVYLSSRPGSSSLSITSAGFHPREGRSSPAYAISAANQFGVDLSDHSSRTVSDELVRSSDIIFLMDLSNFLSWNNSYHQYSNKAFFLGSLNRTNHSDFEVRDPYGNDQDVYETVYGEISTCVDNLIDLINNR